MKLKTGKLRIWARINSLRTKYLSEQEFILILSIVAGFAGGMAALVLKYGVYYLHQAFKIGLGSGHINYQLLLLPIIGITLTILFKKYVLKDSEKHSISSILFAISKKNSMMKAHKMFSSILGGILTAGFGGSVGLEAPIISSGSSIGSNLARKLRLNYKTITVLLACGAAGAISAIFHTPIAAIVFALEVLMIDLSRFTLIPLLISSVTGAIVTNIFYGDALLFNFVIESNFHPNEIPAFIFLGIFTGLLSVYYARTFLGIESKLESIKKSSHRILIGGLIMGTLLFLFPPLISEGFHTVKFIISDNYEWLPQSSIISFAGNSPLVLISFLVVLMLLKVVVTAITIGSGGVGGVFAPSLFTGSIAGLLFAKLANFIFPHAFYSEVNFALVGMASMLGGVLHAPLTGIFLIMEMTTDYELIVPLMLATTISFVTVKYYQPNSIFTVQLAKRGELITHNKDKAILTIMQLKSVIETDLQPIHPDGNLGDLVKIISRSKRNIFPVIDEHKHFFGAIHVEDIRSIMFNSEMYETSVLNLLFIPPEIIESTDSMDLVMKKFERSGAWNLPVVENSKYIGYVSKSKLFNSYRSLLKDISVD